VQRPVSIYLDTVLWNLLCDCAIDPRKVVASLGRGNAKLVLGLHNFYELAKTFRGQGKNALERGQYLFSYLKDFIDADILCVKENDELLAMEMWALQSKTSLVDAFFGKEDLLLLRRGVEKLASGGFDDRTAKFIERQRGFASDIRLGQKRRLENNADAQRFLKNVPSDKVEQWLDAEMRSPSGRENLKDHIRRRFPEAAEIEAMEYASALLDSPASPLAKGLVRAGSYYMWRCACRGSVPADLFDGMYHILNSVHCDVYATQEKKQTEYAKLVLTTSTRVAVYDSGTSLDKWLEALA
jgi:hypothetical protein